MNKKDPQNCFLPARNSSNVTNSPFGQSWSQLQSCRNNSMFQNLFRKLGLIHKWVWGRMAEIGKHEWVISEWTSTFLTPDIIPWDIGFLDKEHCFPELNPVLLHQSVATHLGYRKAQSAGFRIGFQTCMTAAMNLFNTNDLMLYSDI